MSQQGWGGGGGSGGGGWGQGGGYPPGGGGAPPGGGGSWGGAPPGGAPPGGGGYGPPPGGAPPGGGGYGPPPGGAPQNPYAPPGNFAPPPPGYPPGYTPNSPGGVVAWEDSSRGFFSRWWGTTKAVLFDTRNFYTGAAQNEDAMPAVTFSALSAALAGLGIGLTVAVMYLVIGGMGAMGAMGGGRHGGSGGPAGMAAIMGVMGVAAIVIYPILFGISGFIGPWITGGIYHVTLMLFKGANKPYMSSVRVVGYAHAYYMWMMFPLLGYMIGWLPAMVFGVICSVVGLDATHRCGTGKAVAAVFLIPGILALCCCGSYAAMIASVVSSTHR